FLDCLDRFHPKAIQEALKLNNGKKIKTLSDGRGPFRKKAIPLPEWIKIEKKELIHDKNLSSKKELFEGKAFYRYGIEPDWFRQNLKIIQKTQPLDNHEISNSQTTSKNSQMSTNRGKPDLILVSSLMTYWASGVRETISVIKEIFPDVPVVLGGIYATLCTEHARKYSMADLVVTGTGEEQICGIIKSYTGFELKFHSKSAVDSELKDNHFTVNCDSSINGYGDKHSSINLDLLPFPALDLLSNLTYAPILTSRGCPFSCTYCASSFLEEKLRQRSPELVFQEICHWHENYGVHNFAFYDDALLINPERYILPLLDKILTYSSDFKQTYKISSSISSAKSSASIPISFHTPNALHIRQVSHDVADMMFKTGFKTIRLGLETTDFSNSRKEDIKVKEDEFYHAVAMLKQAGFQREQIGAYLLCGLPGQNLDDVERSIMLVKKRGIIPVLAYYTPIPHTPMWKDAVVLSRFDLENEPFFTNNALFPCLNNDHEIKKISELKKMAK
ncbi:MAG: radical SAM protein, partial [Desulfamplus sp.]|nr:radical SAM protein [Desulfamplus sp.]